MGTQRFRTWVGGALLLVAAGCDLWIVTSLWPHSSFSGRSAIESPAGAIVEREGAGLSEACLTALHSLGDAMMREQFARGLFTHGRLAEGREKAGQDYFDEQCPAGAFLAVRQSVADKAEGDRSSRVARAAR
jgi:hypothetical protein